MNDTAAAKSEDGFFALAKALREFKTGPLGGDPSDRAIARAVGVSPFTIGQWLRGERLPQNVDQVLAMVRVVRAIAQSRNLTSQADQLLDPQRWRDAHHAEAERRARSVSAGVRRTQATQILAGSAGWPLGEANDSFTLKVRRLVQQGGPPVEVAVSGLPRETATFTGRDNELEQLLHLLDPSSEEAALVQISAVSGLGGVGKTELVLQAAHSSQVQRWFPGGVLFVNLFGYDPVRRVVPERALDSLLRALNIPKEDIPPDVQDQYRLYTSVLQAHAGAERPILVVIDNAWSAEQAEPLLPPARAGKAVITSRHVLADLGARLIELKPLSTEDAVALIDKKLHQANGPGDTRVQDSVAAGDLAALCGGLPLALQITGATLAGDRSKSLRQMISDLQERENRLYEMQYGDQAVRSSFELSYQVLAQDQQLLFRLLTVNAGPDVSTATAAEIIGQDLRSTRHQLEALARAHLIERDSIGRWHMHDLVRLYAEDLGRHNSIIDSRTVAEERLLRHYLALTRAAVDLIWGRPVPDSGNQFPSPSDAVSWLKAEHANLTAAVVNGCGSHPEISLQIAIPAGMFLGHWRYASEDLKVAEAGLQMARALHFTASEAAALGNLGISLRVVGRTTESLDATTESVALYRQLADDDPDRYEPALGRALANLAGETGASVEDQLAAAEEAVSIGRRLTTDDNAASPDIELAGALHNLGMRLSDIGRHSSAVRAFQEAIDIRRIQASRAPDRFELFLEEILADFALVLSAAGRYEEAITAAQERVEIDRRLAANDLNLRGPDLVRALKQLEGIFTDVGRAPDAQAVADEATNVQLMIAADHGGT